jgi:hypothetical protein
MEVFEGTMPETDDPDSPSETHKRGHENQDFGVGNRCILGLVVIRYFPGLPDMGCPGPFVGGQTQEGGHRLLKLP